MNQPPAVPPRQPLPGRPITSQPAPAWHPDPEQLLLDEVPLHGRYTQHHGKDGSGHPARESIWHGKRDVTGTEVRGFLHGSMGFWLHSHAAVEADGTVHYRQTRNHNAVSFVPDRESGVVVNRPDHQVTEGAYLTTGPDGTPRLWRASGVRQAVKEALRPGPSDWPRGWALLMPDGAVRFAPGGFPWSKEEIYTAQPAPAPESWGPECTRCGRIEAEHDPGRAWAGCWPREMVTAE
ncbi:hypothetical protein ACFC26_21790 [Kitasatospora purpeofusca]|uniref:hypothetical protein n=1 Tax=Kitasatospora purpeofusca TaxID=67352 RepID=UPI0035D8577B